MQRVEVLRDVKYFSAVTALPPGIVTTSTEEYYTASQTTQGSVVNPTNIRAFLGDERNQEVINGFMSYLSGSSLMNSQANTGLFVATPYFREIFYDDEKLSNVFNEYYNQTVLRGISLDDSVLTRETTNISVISTGLTYVVDTVSDNLFRWVYAGNMSIKYMDYIPLEMVNTLRLYEYHEEYIPLSTEDNYYIDIKLNRSWNPIAQEKPELHCESVYEIQNIGIETISSSFGAYNTYGYSSSYNTTSAEVNFYAYFQNSQTSTSTGQLYEELFTVKKYYEYSVVLSLADFIKSNGFVISGSFALSKQGTVYRKGYSDLDVVKLVAVPEYVDISGGAMPLIGFSVNSYGIVPAIVQEFINLFPSNYITRVQKLQVLGIGGNPVSDGYRVYIGEFPVDVYAQYISDLYSVVPTMGIMNYEQIFLIKSAIGRKKDLQDIKLFKKYESVKSFDKDMYINATNSIVQCFVDLNDQEESNDIWSSPIREVNLEFQNYTIEENETVYVNVDLNRPALGNEQITVSLSVPISSFFSLATLTGANKDLDNPNEITFYFSKGQVRATVGLRALADLEFENNELFVITLTNPVNLVIGEKGHASGIIIDTTEKREVSFIQNNGVPDIITLDIIGSGYSYAPVDVPVYNYYVDEPLPDGTTQTQTYSVQITLDEPSTINNEEITVYISREPYTIPQIYSSTDNYPTTDWHTELATIQTSISVSPGPFSITSNGGVSNQFLTAYSVKWTPGQQVKTLSFDIPKDLVYPEATEVFYIFLGYPASEGGSPWEGSPLSSTEIVNVRLARVFIRNTPPTNYIPKFTTFDFQNIFVGISKPMTYEKSHLFYDNNPNTLDARSFFKNWDYLPDGEIIYDPNIPLGGELLGKASTRLRIKNRGDVPAVLTSGFTEDITILVNETVEILQTQLESGTFNNLKLSLPANYDFVDAGTGGTYYDKTRYEVELAYFIHPSADNTSFKLYRTDPYYNKIEFNDGDIMEYDAYEYEESIIQRKYAVSFLNSVYTNYDSTATCNDRCMLNFNTYTPGVISGGANATNGIVVPISSSRIEKCEFVDYPINIDYINGCSGCTSGTTLAYGQSLDPAIAEGRLIPFIWHDYFDYIYNPPLAAITGSTMTSGSAAPGLGIATGLITIGTPPSPPVGPQFAMPPLSFSAITI